MEVMGDIKGSDLRERSSKASAYSLVYGYHDPTLAHGVIRGAGPTVCSAVSPGRRAREM